MQVYCRRIHCCRLKMCPHRQSHLDYWPCWWNVQLCAQVNGRQPGRHIKTQNVASHRASLPPEGAFPWWVCSFDSHTGVTIPLSRRGVCGGAMFVRDLWLSCLSAPGPWEPLAGSAWRGNGNKDVLSGHLAQSLLRLWHIPSRSAAGSPLDTVLPSSWAVQPLPVCRAALKTELYRDTISLYNFSF